MSQIFHESLCVVGLSLLAYPHTLTKQYGRIIIMGFCGSKHLIIQSLIKV